MSTIVSTRPCDRYPAETAQYEVVTPHGTLDFCGHHYRQYSGRFEEENYPVIDLVDPLRPVHATRVLDETQVAVGDEWL